MKKVTTTLALFLLFTVSTFAQKLPFQGYLEESGIPVEGTRDFTFELTDYSWTETFTAVPVSKGVYNVVLGSTTPLPGILFNNVDDTPMQISVDANVIGSVTLFRPIVNSLDISGVNDSTNLTVGSTNDGYYGNIGIFDSLGVTNGFLRARNNGGYLQLSKLDGSGNFQGAVTAGVNSGNPSLNLFGQNSTLDNAELMINNYVTAREPLNGPLYSGNYKRSGTDWLDNTGRLTVAIGINRLESSGADPTGSSGYVLLWGDQTQNFNLGADLAGDNDRPIFEMFGSNDDGGGGSMRNITLEVSPGASTDNQGNILLSNTDNGGITSDAVVLTSNLNATGGGGIEVKDNTSANRIILEGQTGLISSERASGGSAINLFQNAGSGGIAVENAAQDVNFFYEAESNILDFSNSGAATIQLDGATGTINAIGVITGETTIPSDRRLKREITTLDNALENTLKMRGTSYFWKDEKKTQELQIGVIAQEVEEIYPGLVHTNRDGFKSVNYAQMTAVLIEAVKELNTKIEKLEDENENLTSALNQQKELNERITKLEKLLLENAKVATNE